MSKSQGGKNAVSVLTSESTSRGGTRARILKNHEIFNYPPEWNAPGNVIFRAEKPRKNGVRFKRSGEQIGSKTNLYKYSHGILETMWWQKCCQIPILYTHARLQDDGSMQAKLPQIILYYIILYYIILYYIILYYIIKYNKI